MATRSSPRGLTPPEDGLESSLPALPAAAPGAGVDADLREGLRAALAEADRTLAAALRRGVPAGRLVQRRAAFVDGVVQAVFAAFLGSRVDGSGLAVFAVGGYGRGELFPHSDTDLLVLCRERPEGVLAAALAAVLACLWDLGLRPAQAVRTLAECREVAAGDASAWTSLLDARCLAGDADLVRGLDALLADDTLWPPAAYLAAKRAEQRARHARFDDTAHNLEPNLKDGPGGLRTLQLLGWLGQRLLGAGTLAQLAARGMLDPAELAGLRGARETLQTWRYALHLEAGRPEERLLFDHQRALAETMGFRDREASAAEGAAVPVEPQLGVEQFMQAYYRAATLVERLGVQVTERFEEWLEPPAPPVPLDSEFCRRGLRLEGRDPEIFRTDPAALLRAFHLRVEHPELTGFTADGMRAIQDALAHWQGRLADNPAVLAAFLALLRRGAPAVRALWSMNRHGVLAAILPAFARIVGRMQYDLFHAWTVDEHTLRVLRNVAAFAEPRVELDFPLAYELFANLEKPERLLLGALFHDLAKGRGGDHSLLGEEEARAFCTRLGLDADDTELVAWLVRRHLLMSVTAQRQDITDPAVVHAFAREVGDWERLDHLYLLTVADIRGTSPRLWNGWKDRLLADLYVAARYALRSEFAAPPRAETRVQACREAALALLADADPARVAAIWADFPDASFLRHRPEQIAWQTRALLHGGERPLVAANALSVRGTTELFVCAEDRTGLFADITATLDRQHFSVVEARVLGSRSGLALDTFLLLDGETLKSATPQRADTLARELREVLRAAPGRVRPVQRGLSRQLRHFQIAPRTEYRHDAASGRTQLALVCTDRPGLLAAVARAFVDTGVKVHDARVATFGERVEDFFHLTDAADRPLDAALQARLDAALAERILA